MAVVEGRERMMRMLAAMAMAGMAAAGVSWWGWEPSSGRAKVGRLGQSHRRELAAALRARVMYL